MITEMSTHSDAACAAWCAQQNDGACSNGTYTHHHPAGDTGVTCTSTTVGGGNGGTVGQAADSFLGGFSGSLIKKLAKASDSVKHWTCSRSFHFTCNCSGEVVTPNETQTTLEQQMTSDPLLQQ